MATVAADPYPWPYDDAELGGQLALVVAGAQHAFAGASIRPGAAAEVLHAVAAAVRRVGGVVVVLRHAALPSARLRTLPPVAGTAGWDLAIDVERGDLIVDVGGLDGFALSPLDGLLRGLGRTHLLLGGFAEELAVSSTLRGANDRGYECLTLVDGVAHVDRATGERSLASTTMSGGIFGAIAPSTALLDVLAPARTPLEVP